MDDAEALALINGVFGRINNAGTQADLRQIPINLVQLAHNYHDETAYPRIGFTITLDEILRLERIGLIEEKTALSSDISNHIFNPIAKILYSIVWKNNKDLKKLRNIIEGIRSDDDTLGNYTGTALVFHQFGKHLKSPVTQPIVDQHVIRAYAVFTSQAADITANRNRGELNKGDLVLVNNYIEWLRSNDLNEAIRGNTDCLFVIDRILFAAGKTIKSH